MVKSDSNKAFRWQSGILISIVIFLLIWIGLVLFTLYHRHDLVSSDYYAQELTYQKQIDDKRRSLKLNNPLQINFNTASRLLNLRFPTQFSPLAIQGSVALFRSSDKNLDRSYKIAPDSLNTQNIDLSTFIKGPWTVIVKWSVDSADFYDEYEIQIK